MQLLQHLLVSINMVHVLQLIEKKKSRYISTKYLQDLYGEDLKERALMKEIKDHLSKWRVILCP